ncbi:hypothetical protein MVEN_02172400 [Mycena venus]|uniref:DUF6535 domain-containing protein n=1 Tax=Mycena venus TaxID=2733690 RepID=A0A8H6X921_9AGAR|nr:hypothetical protein MVEN_02172400 [Mycena venus]
MPHSYAPNLGMAESQIPHEMTPDAQDKDSPAADSGSPYSQHYQPAAAIWKFYLQETDAEDKKLTELWQIGLDQLLIFAGLFGAILTAFLIESRKNLKEDPLQQILLALRNDSASSRSEPFRPTKSSLIVNAVWFSSLGLTLISALAAVLAKGWVAQYTPTTHGLHSNDACERHLRYLRSRQWRLDMIVGGIPLLIQVALFLFAIGLVILTWSDDLGISIALLVMTASTTCLYILGTILPWFSAGCPFQTTMSEFIPGVATHRQYADSVSADNQRPEPHLRSHRAYLQWRKIIEFLREARRKPGQLEIEADILAWMLTRSTDENAIEEAVRAIAGANPTVYLRDTLDQSGASKILCERFIQYVRNAPGQAMNSQEVLRAEAYLYAILRLVEPAGEMGPNIIGKPEKIKLEWQVLLQLGQPLHRWDQFVDYLQPLAFALRTRLLLATGDDDHTEQWEKTRRNLITMAERGCMPEVRRVLVGATIEGLLHVRGIQMRKTCAILLCKLLQIGESKWMGIFRVQVLIMSLSADSRRIAAKEIRIGGAIRAMVDVLRYADRESSEVILEGMMRLAQFVEFRETIATIIPLTTGLLTEDGKIVGMRGVNILSRLSEQAEFREFIAPRIPGIIDLLKGDNRYGCRMGGLLLSNISAQVEFRDVIQTSIPHLAHLLIDKDWFNRVTGADALSALAEYAEFREKIGVSIPQVLALAKDEHNYARQAALAAFSKFWEHVEFKALIGTHIHLLVPLLTDNNLSIRKEVVDVVLKLSEQGKRVTRFHRDAHFSDFGIPERPWLVCSLGGYGYIIKIFGTG